jgi:hypothetical protein
MEFVYVVFGGTGEYSDYIEWAVRAFETEEEAVILVNRLKELSKDIESWHPYSKLDDISEELLFLDPNFGADYNGTYYTYSKIPFGDLKYFLDKTHPSC